MQIKNFSTSKSNYSSVFPRIKKNGGISNTLGGTFLRKCHRLFVSRLDEKKWNRIKRAADLSDMEVRRLMSYAATIQEKHFKLRQFFTLRKLNALFLPLLFAFLLDMSLSRWDFPSLFLLSDENHQKLKPDSLHSFVHKKILHKIFNEIFFSYCSQKSLIRMLARVII